MCCGLHCHSFLKKKKQGQLPSSFCFLLADCCGYIVISAVMLYIAVDYGTLKPSEDGITGWILISVLAILLTQPSNCCQFFFFPIRLNGLEKELMSWPLLKLHPLIKSEAARIATHSLTTWRTFLRLHLRLNGTLLKPIKPTSQHFEFFNNVC